MQRSWVNRAGRFYTVSLIRDLFDGWSLVREWGQLGQGGRTLITSIPSRQKADSLIEEIGQQRQREGYDLVDRAKPNAARSKSE